MQQNTASFPAPDGLNIYTISWLPDNTPKAMVILVHGVGEHVGRYQHVAEALVEAGYGVFGLDHRGHGRSDGERVQVNSHTQFIDDLKQYFDSIRSQHQTAKILLLGHSMGSIISLQFALKYQRDLAGLVVTGTATDVASTVPPLVRAGANFVLRFILHFPVGALPDVNVLTSDPEMQHRWLADNYVYRGRLSACIVKYILDTGEAIQGRAAELTLPMLIMHGEADQLTPISGSHIMNEQIGSGDKTLKTWPGMRHEVMNEVGREAVIGTIVEWLDKH